LSEPLRIYICGPVMGTTDYVQRFQQGALEVAELGHLPVNPLVVNTGVVDSDPESRRAGLIADIRTLLECDGIYMLDNWWDSRGARIEHTIAVGLGYLVLYQINRRKESK
jgi:hypothetical protein